MAGGRYVVRMVGLLLARRQCATCLLRTTQPWLNSPPRWRGPVVLGRGGCRWASVHDVDRRILAAFAHPESAQPFVPTADESADSARPPTPPSGKFRPKQSLGQNYLSDQNYALKICDSVRDESEGGRTVVELGPGLGALTRILLKSFPEMVAVEIDGRAVELLRERYPALSVVHSDVLEIDYTQLAQLRGNRLNVVGNLPFYITSQILFTLCDHHAAVERACVTMQWEVAQRMVAKPRTKDYGILSVVFQLYSRPEILFKIPNTAFYPQPKVTSALVAVHFPRDRPPFPVDPAKLRLVVTTAFRQRRKMLRQSLKGILNGVTLPDQWATKRPEELPPPDFLKLTGIIFGFRDTSSLHSTGGAEGDDDALSFVAIDSGAPLWRKVDVDASGDMRKKRQQARAAKNNKSKTPPPPSS